MTTAPADRAPFPGGARFAVSLTYDVEQCTNFPYWSSVWDHRKGALDGESWRYVARLADMAAAEGAPVQWFVLGSTLQEVDSEIWELLSGGGAVGNHTFRHVNVRARDFDDLQIAYRTDPALRSGFAMPLDAIRSEIETTSEWIERRTGRRPAGFRTPGGFSEGLRDHPEVCEVLRAAGFHYVSSHYRYPCTASPRPSMGELEQAMRWSLSHLQPYRYSDGLLEIPMMGISDIWAFRVLDLEREEWIRLLEVGIKHAAAEGLLFSILMHPPVLACRDPHAATLRRVLDKTISLGGCILTNDLAAEQYA